MNALAISTGADAVATRQRRVPQDANRKFSKPLHRVRAPNPVAVVAEIAPSVAANNATEICQVSHQKLSSSPDKLSERLAKALHRIIRVDKVLTVEQLADAHGLNCSRQTVYDWLGGYRDPRGEHLCALIHMFGPAFANEVIGSDNIYVINPSADRRAALLQRIAETQAELMQMEAAR